MLSAKRWHTVYVKLESIEKVGKAVHVVPHVWNHGIDRLIHNGYS
jgi:hypothetical protein